MFSLFATLATAKISFESMELFAPPAPAPLGYPAGTWLPGNSGCYCGGASHPGADGIAEFNGEWAPAMTHIGFGGVFMCNGGCAQGGLNQAYDYVYHYEKAYVVTITAWSGQQCGIPIQGPAITKMCFKFTNGKTDCVGGTRDAQCGSGLGTPSSYTFEEGETLSDFKIGGNVHGRSNLGRVVYFEFTTIKADGTMGGWRVGSADAANAPPLKNNLEALNVQGTVFSGFFGKAYADVDQMGALVAKPICPVTHRVITDVKCSDPVTGSENCAASWQSTEGMMDVSAICDNCQHSHPVDCDFTFSWSTTNDVSMTSSQMDSLSADTSASLTMGISTEVGFEFLAKAEVSAETTFSVGFGYGHTWEQSKTTTTSKTGTVGSSCKLPGLPANEKSTAKGTMVVGKLTGHVQFQVTSYTSCGGVQKELHPVTLTIGNVPGIGGVSHCKFEDASCTYAGMEQF